jgi:uncharacterized alpha/beta hydrolase family protein
MILTTNKDMKGFWTLTRLMKVTYVQKNDRDYGKDKSPITLAEAKEGALKAIGQAACDNATPSITFEFISNEDFDNDLIECEDWTAEAFEKE